MKIQNIGRTLLLSKMNGVFLRPEGQAGTLHIICSKEGIHARRSTKARIKLKWRTSLPNPSVDSPIFLRLVRYPNLFSSAAISQYRFASYLMLVEKCGPAGGVIHLEFQTGQEIKVQAIESSLTWSTTYHIGRNDLLRWRRRGNFLWWFFTRNYRFRWRCWFKSCNNIWNSPDYWQILPYSSMKQRHGNRWATCGLRISKAKCLPRVIHAISTRRLRQPDTEPDRNVSPSEPRQSFAVSQPKKLLLLSPFRLMVSCICLMLLEINEFISALIQDVQQKHFHCTICGRFL